ncbi:hypothetical protein J2W30_006729 [Variovorax boronicumulans]|nr:hypothetical protein [Variovorax boronicumulans]
MLSFLKQEPQPNVYQMWFSIQPKTLLDYCTTWLNRCAKVVSIVK